MTILEFLSKFKEENLTINIKTDDGYYTTAYKGTIQHALENKKSFSIRYLLKQTNFYSLLDRDELLVINVDIEGKSE